jgi:hypothetical protein
MRRNIGQATALSALISRVGDRYGVNLRNYHSHCSWQKTVLSEIIDKYTSVSNWGAPRIHGELLKLGFEVSERTVSNLMPRHPPNSKPSQTWRTLLRNVLSSYFEYYHSDRTHLSLEKDTPGGRPAQHRPAGKCKIIELPRIGGLHHL